jgi:hypothetical protein
MAGLKHSYTSTPHCGKDDALKELSHEVHWTFVDTNMEPDSFSNFQMILIFKKIYLSLFYSEQKTKVD